jgi:hypothetical protein
MEKEFVPYELALELKKLGFDEPCFGLYAPPSKTVFLHHYGLLSAKEQILAPLYQQAFRWFREKYGLWQTVLQNTDVDWTYDILPINGIHDYKLIDVFETYEETELACLKKLIELIKSK